MIAKTTFLWEKVRNNIREEIISGNLKSGDRLPTYSEACKKYKVSQPVILKAYNSLERDGLVFRRYRGLYVSENPLTPDRKDDDDVVSTIKINTLTKEHLAGMANTLNLLYCQMLLSKEYFGLLDLCSVDSAAQLLSFLAECMPDNADVVSFLTQESQIKKTDE